MSLGKGAISTHSLRQKLNTRSSTESELVAVDDITSHVIWTKHFLESQGYATSGTVIYQDNQSEILLERNGIKSTGKRSKHINVQYFFIKDRVSKKELAIEWCSSGDMLGDYFTKTLQGENFFRLRKVIMNLS